MQSQAFDLGMKKFSWWPDWRGKPVVIVASGPSTAGFPVDRLRDSGAGVIAIKQNVDKAPWAEFCYGCDAPWWISRRGLPEFSGIKMAHGQKALTRYPDIKQVLIDNVHRILVDEPLRVGSGRNSGFQALNLAIQFGSSRILLVGYDFHGRSGFHWYGRNQAYGMSNPTDFNFKDWVPIMIKIAPWLRDNDIEVLNASPTSDLKCFRRGCLEDVLAAA